MSSQFFLLDSADLARPSLSETPDNIDDHPIGLQRKYKELYDNLLKDFAGLPKASQNINHDNYAVVNVAPALVPNPYLPSFRIFVYNTTGIAYTPGDLGHNAQLDSEATETHGTDNRLSDLAASLCANPANENTWRCKLDQPWHSNESSPSRENRLWTPLGYAQVSATRWIGDASNLCE